ncbi:MAG TPA: hypothetical protein VMU04_24740 [Candidatus Acidoferrum sp.]|nr:hypothetical protein [Candidatus Acidoferrum sp.]
MTTQASTKAGRKPTSKRRAQARAIFTPARHVLVALDDTLPAFQVEHDSSPGQGAGQVNVSIDALDNVPLRDALVTGYIPAGPLLQAAQAQLDLARAKRQAKRLVASMTRNGAQVGNAVEPDAIGDACNALQTWRNLIGPKQLESPGLISWRACVESVAKRDLYGESISLWEAPWSHLDAQGYCDSGAWDSLTGSALPLPQLTGDASRADRASRLLYERARAKRPALLARRIDALKQGQNGRRLEAIDRLHRACILMLHGQSLDGAAQAVGYHASGQGRHAVKAGDVLLKAARRIGLRVAFTQRDIDRLAS